MMFWYQHTTGRSSLSSTSATQLLLESSHTTISTSMLTPLESYMYKQPVISHRKLSRFCKTHHGSHPQVSFRTSCHQQAFHSIVSGTCTRKYGSSAILTFKTLCVRNPQETTPRSQTLIKHVQSNRIRWNQLQRNLVCVPTVEREATTEDHALTLLSNCVCTALLSSSE